MTGFAMTVLADSWGIHNMGTGAWIVMMLGTVIFWGALIALVVWLVRGRPTSRSEPPQEILRRRLAAGSISVEEYEQRRAALDSSTQATGKPTTPDPSPST